MEEGIETRVQAVLASRADGAGAYTEEEALRIGRMWRLLVDAGLDYKGFRTNENGFWHLHLNGSVAVAPDGTFCGPEYRKVRVPLRGTKKRITPFLPGALAMSAAIGLVVDSVLFRGASGHMFAVIAAGMLALAVVLVVVAATTRTEVQTSYVPLDAQRRPSAVAEAYDDIRWMLRGAEADYRKVVEIKRFANESPVTAKLLEAFQA